jgi:hypothetical protein
VPVTAAGVGVGAVTVTDREARVGSACRTPGTRPAIKILGRRRQLSALQPQIADSSNDRAANAPEQ